jgi:hypothetical protein
VEKKVVLIRLQLLNFLKNVRKLFRKKFSGEEGSVDKVAAPEFSEECEKTVQEKI